MTMMQWNTLGVLAVNVIGLLLLIAAAVSHRMRKKELGLSTLLTDVLFFIGAPTLMLGLMGLVSMWPQIGQAWFGVQK